MRLKIYGPPGTGKTTRLARLTRTAHAHHGDRVLIASLTNAAASEIRGRDLPLSRHRVGTLHHHAYQALNGGVVFTKALGSWNDAYPAWAISAGSAKQRAAGLIPPEDDDEVTPHDDPSVDNDALYGELRGDALLQRYDILRHLMRPRELWDLDLREFARAWEDWKHETDVLDFTDMIACAYRDCARPFGHIEAGIFDEVQDFSRLELALVDRWSQSMESVALAGDDDQAIYTWRGADPSAFVGFDADQTEVLDQSYRMPSAIHAFSQRWIAQLPERANKPFRPRDAIGSVDSTTCSFGAESADHLIESAERHLADGKTVMLLAPCAYMLDAVIAAARRHGLPFHNPYRRRNGRWNPLGVTNGIGAKDRLLAYLRPDPDVWGDEARMWDGSDIARWAKPLRAEVLSGRNAAAELDGDYPVSLDWLEAHVPAKWRELLAVTPAAYERALNPSQVKPLVFPLAVAHRRGAAALRGDPQLIVGTIHSVKGGECDVVYLAPDLSAQGWTSYRADPAETIRQFYVGMTRAKESLVVTAPMRRSGSRYLQSLVRMAREAAA